MRATRRSPRCAARRTGDVRGHRALRAGADLACRPRTRPGSPPPTPLPSTLPDVRSLFLGFHYSLARLPAEPMRPRVADERIGYFWTDRLDFTSRHAARADRPLRLPLAPREEGSRAGALGAQAADRLLARAQHPRALPPGHPRGHPRVEQGVRADRLQGCDPRRGPARRRRVGCRRRASRLGALDDHGTSDASAPSARRRVDPRTGEILDADIGFDANAVRSIRHLRVERIATAGIARAPASEGLDGSASTPTARRRRRASPSICSKRAARSRPTAPTSTSSSTRTSRT